MKHRPSRIGIGIGSRTDNMGIGSSLVQRGHEKKYEQKIVGTKNQLGRAEALAENNEE